MMKGILLRTRRVVSSLLLCLLLLVVGQTALAAPLQATPPAVTSPTPPVEKDGENEAQWAAPVIRAILIGASNLWRFRWFQNSAVSYVLAQQGQRAAAAIQANWVGLGRTVENLIGQDVLTWTVVREAFLVKMMNTGVPRVVAEGAAIGLRDFLMTLSSWF